MNTIKIADATLCRNDINFSFKEKLEIARQLERLRADIIEFPEIVNKKTDILMIRTASSFVKSSLISVAAGVGEDSVMNAVAALSGIENCIVRIELPVSPVGMEYTCHKKAPKLLEYIKTSLEYVKKNGISAEFCAVDATRAEYDFLVNAVETAQKAGADYITVCDSAGNLMPCDFSDFIKEISKTVNIPLGVKCDNSNGLALSSAVMSVDSGAQIIKTSVGGNIVQLDVLQNMITNCGTKYGICTGLRNTELRRIVKQINWITDNSDNDKTAVNVANYDISLKLDVNDTKEEVYSAVRKLGYELSEEDLLNVYNEFLRVASKKDVGAKELDAIVASAAMQVPPTYKLKTYVINNGNVINSTAQITLIKGNDEIDGIALASGPIDASFMAIEKILGKHYELEDFQIQSVTEGKEAMGWALVKIRSNGKLYSGNGISTDIIGASIRAYLGAVNKMAYEEE